MRGDNPELMQETQKSYRRRESAETPSKRETRRSTTAEEERDGGRCLLDCQYSYL